MKCIYNEWKGLFGWTSDLRALFLRSWRQQESTSLRKVMHNLVTCVSYCIQSFWYSLFKRFEFCGIKFETGLFKQVGHVGCIIILDKLEINNSYLYYHSIPNSNLIVKYGKRSSEIVRYSKRL